jgi:hypothetical protein
MGAAPSPLLPPARARTSRMHALCACAVRTLGARAAPLPPPQLRARQPSDSCVLLLRCPRRLSRRGDAAAPLQRVRAGSVPDDILTSLQRGPPERGDTYLPHDVLRAAIQLDEMTRSRNSHAAAPPACLYVACERTAALLARNPALLRVGAGGAHVQRTRARCYKFTLDGRRGSASQEAASAAVAPPPATLPREEEVTAARKRLLRLLEAVEAAAPEVLRGSARTKRTTTSMQAITLRTCALAAFAAHVPDEAWVNAPDTWTPRKSHRRARCCEAPCLALRHDAGCASVAKTLAFCVSLSTSLALRAAWRSRCARSSRTSSARALKCRWCCTKPSRHGTRSTPTPTRARQMLTAARSCGGASRPSSSRRRAATACATRCGRSCPHWRSRAKRHTRSRRRATKPTAA